MANTTTDFAFVNESGPSTAHKAGHRQNVHSHVRKHVAKRFKQKHKIGRMSEASENLTPLASRNPGHHNASQFLPLDDYCLSTLFESASDMTSLGYAKGLPNEHAAPIPMAGDSAGIGMSSSTYELAPGTVDTNSPGISPSDLQVYFGPHYKGSGRILLSSTARKLQPDDERWNVTIPKLKESLDPSPLQFLGAGRVDPFLSLPVKKPDRAMHELVDLCANYLLPGLVPGDSQDLGANSGNAVARAWVSSSLKFPFLFHALLFAASIHRDFMRHSKIYPDSPQALSHKLIVIQKLNEYISKNKNASRDEVILAILVLSSHETMNVTEERRKPFNSPLKTAQWLNVYGNIVYVPEHMKAVLNLVNSRGGIENLKLHGLGETIVVGDIVSSLNSGSKPVQPPLRIHETYIDFVNKWATSSSQIRVQTLATAFWDLQDYGLTDRILGIFNAMGAVTLAIKHYIQGHPSGLTLGQIARTRTAIQHRLLLLPSAEELDIGSPSKPNIYECCRVTAVIFSVAVIFPIPNTYDVLQTLVQRLKTALKSSGIDSQRAKCSEVFLWILVIGGIAALDKPERPWFVSQLARVVERLKIDWRGAEEILDSFLWLEFACNTSGHQLWDEVMDLKL